MSEIPSELKYTKTHEWVLIGEDGTATVGVTDHAQELLGDIVYTELPEVGSEFTAESECAVVESVKAAADVYMPLSGEIVAVNELLQDAPETINQSPFEKGWIFKIKFNNESELDNLLDNQSYQNLTNEESH